MKMPDRTLEELRQIREDFILIKKAYDEKLEGLRSDYLENLFDGRSRNEELEDYNNSVIEVFQYLLDSGNIKSCECITLIQRSIIERQKWIETPGVWAYLNVQIKPSNRVKPVNDLTLDEVVSLLRKNPFNDRLNQNLDKIGTDACVPIACNEIELGSIELSNSPEEKCSLLPEYSKNDSCRTV